MPLHRPVRAEVDLGAIRHNAALLRAHADPAELMAVVKADGYGHGAVPSAQAALDGGATWLGVALVEEGEQLRAAGIRAPILVLSEPPPAAATAMLEADLTPTVYTHRFVQALVAAGRDRGSGPVAVHLKLDTGMRRVGLIEPLWDEVFGYLARSADITVTGIWSHLAVGDEPGNPYTVQQTSLFASGVERARAAGLAPDLVHLANSGGTQLGAGVAGEQAVGVHHDLVRTGIAVYGLEAAPGIRLDGLRPAMSLRSELTLVKPVLAGQQLSYGLRFTAAHDTVIGTVAGGYADGIRRGLTNTGQVWVGGRRVPIVGTVSMDQITIDLGPEATDTAGDDVWLFGGPDETCVTVEEWASWLDTITYEVTCGISARVPRVYR
ncbi:alanine racemase [Euzebya tangerina]|uniref:alanine racemase n=1 Tax=Euzebya tangerina TaxID=591198 RepID=UPI000E3114A0|nr:alanine racemase [Euzebya tangerina]